MSDDSKNLKSIQAAVDVAKNIVLLGALVYGLIYGRQALQTVLNQITKGERVATELSIGKEGITVKLAEAKASLMAAANSQVKGEGKLDQPPSQATKEILTALEGTDKALADVSRGKVEQAPAASPASGIMLEVWVYLGIEHNGNWHPNYFGLSGRPRIGTKVAAAGDVYERDAKPIYVPSIEDWKLGRVVGLMRRGDSASILELESIESDNGGMIWWGRIR